MKLRAFISIAVVLLTASRAVAQAPPAPPADRQDDEAYKVQLTSQESELRPEKGETEPDGDSFVVRREWMRQRMGGDLGADFKESLLQQATQERAKYPLQAAGAAGAAAQPAWVNIGPTRANWLQNGVIVTAIDSGRARAILPHPTDPDTVYFLSSGGGLWKTQDFTHPKSTWVPKTDGLFSTSGGSAAFGRNPQTLYLGLGDPFDFPANLKGVMYKTTDGGDTWSALKNLTGATVVLDVKVDAGGPQDVVLVGTDAGLFRSADSGNSYTKVASGPGQPFFASFVWSLARTGAGWLAAAESFAGVGSLFLSTDRGATWSPITNAGNVYAGAGRTTLGVGAPGDAVVYAFAADTGDIAQLDLFRSADGGQNWTALNITGKTPTNPSFFQRDMNLMGGQAFYNHMILVNPSDPSRNTVYLGGQLASARTRDGGNTWTLLSDWLAFSGLPYVHADFHAAAFSRFGGTETLFFGTDGGLFVSQDDGVRWSDAKNEGLVTHLIYALSSNPQHSDRTLIGLQDDGSRYRHPNSTSYSQVLGGDGFGTGWSQANDAVSIASIYFGRIRRNDRNPPNTQAKWEIGSRGIDRSDVSFFTPLTTPTPEVDPTGLEFLTYAHHHVYKTTDGALTWTSIGDAGRNGLPASTFFRDVIHGLGVSPVDGSHLGVAMTGGRVAFTRDGGASWTVKPLNALVPGFASFTANVAYAPNPADPAHEVMYVCSENPSASPTSVKVAKSTDGGQTWSASDGGLPKVPVIKIQVDPRNAGTLYAATYLGVYRSTDGGASWSLFGNGLPTVVVSDLYMPPDGSFLRAATYGRGVWEVTP